MCLPCYNSFTIFPAGTKRKLRCALLAFSVAQWHSHTTNTNIHTTHKRTGTGHALSFAMATERADEARRGGAGEAELDNSQLSVPIPSSIP